MQKPFTILILFMLALAPMGSLSRVASRDASAPAQILTDTTLTASIIHAASCSQADIQAAIDAASDGDFVLIPAGHCTWITPASSKPSVILNRKGIILQGAGIDQTVITDGTTTAWNETPLRVDGVEGRPFRITGFTFVGNGQNDSFPVIQVNGECKDWRIDHIKFNDAKRAVSTSGYTYGVIDHCTFSNHTYDFPYQAIAVSADDNAWQRPLTLGTANAVYVEDCLFDYTQFGNTVDGHIGARFVFRHNTLNGTYVEAHGFCCNLSRGTFSYEVYSNTITGNSASWVPFAFRGGTGVVFDNAIGGHFEFPHIEIYNDRSCPDRAWQGVCDGTSPVDGNQDSTGYPCRDQIGRSTDLPGGQQTLEPLYEWDNTYNGSDVDVKLNPGLCTQMANHLKENRDFYNDRPRPGYTPYIYPHPLTKDLVLSGAPADQVVHLSWQIKTILPLTSTWRIDHTSQTGTAYLPITGIISSTRACSLTGLTNYVWYTVTLNAMLDSTRFLTDTVRVMPTNRLVYLPLITR